MTWSTLLVRIASRCDGACSDCPWRSKHLEILPHEIVGRIVRLLDDYIFNESVILCPNPLIHPRLDAIINMLSRVSRRIYMMIPITCISSSVRRNVIELIDEIVLITSSINDFRRAKSSITSMLSNGIENISIYIVFTGENVDELIEIIYSAKEYGLRIRIGEAPYINKLLYDVRPLLRRKGFEIGLVYGFLYGYRASIAFIEKYPVTILQKPCEGGCRKIYIDPYGYVRKCPFYGESVPSSELTPIRIKKILFGECRGLNNLIKYIPKIAISVATLDGKIIPEDILNLLEVISRVKSLRAACNLLGLPPSTYIEKIRNIERKLGIKLLATGRGGSLKGFTLLTSEAERILEIYRKTRDVILEALLKSELKDSIIT